MTNFPLIMKFYRTFKNEDAIYFLTQFIEGSELFDVIREMGLLTSTQAQFYIGSMILALEHMHSKNIIYRDIKPENIMVDKNGIMYLIDLGTAKVLNEKRHHGMALTMIGTPHYMAPEVYEGGKGYTQLVDLWSVGICLYEFVVGCLPFGEDLEDP